MVVQNIIRLPLVLDFATQSEGIPKFSNFQIFKFLPSCLTS